MQVGVDVKCMHTNFGGRGLSSFGDIATFKNGQISLLIHGLYKVLTFNKFYPKNCPSDFKIIYTKKLQVFFSIFWYNFKILRQNFQFMHPCFLLMFFPFMNFISRTVHWILKSFTPKNCKFFSLFFGIISNF